MPNRKTDRDGSNTSSYVDEMDSYIIKDIDGVYRIIPRKNFIKSDPKNLALLGTNIVALTYLLKEVQNTSKGSLILINYDSLRDKH